MAAGRTTRRRLSRTARSDVEARVEDVPVLDDVGLAFELLLAGPRGLRMATGRDEIVPAHDLAADEAARDVGVNRLRGIERRFAASQRPGPRLLVARGEERDQVERLREPAHDLAERRLATAPQLLADQGSGQLDHALLGGPAHDHGPVVVEQLLEGHDLARDLVPSRQ